MNTGLIHYRPLGFRSKTLVQAIALVLLLLLPVTPVLAAPAVDGDGQVTVSPTSVTYGTSSTYTFTFTATNEFGPSSKVQISVPTGWKAPTLAAGAGHVALLSGATCTLSAGTPLAVSGMAITVSMDGCSTGNTFSLSYATVTTGSVVGSPYTFTAQTDIGPGGGGLKPTTAPAPTISVGVKTLTVSATGLTPSNKVYDRTTAVTGFTPGSPTLVGVVSPDVVTLVTSGITGVFSDLNAGVAKTVTISGLTLGGAGAGNYTLTQPTRKADIKPRPITITAVSDTKTYDGTFNSVGVPTITSGSIVPGDTAPVWTQTFNNENAGLGKVVVPVQGVIDDGNAGGNYAYTFASVSTGTINKLGITITAVTDSKTYDGLATSSGIPLLSDSTPLIVGDTAAGWSQTFSDKNIGSGKTITPAGLVSDGNGGNNYAYNFVPDTTGSISTKAITVTPLTDTKLYDGTVASSVAPNISPALAVTDTSGFVQTFDTAGVGTNKTLAVSGTVNDGNGGNNYTITIAPPITTGIINAKPVTVTADYLTKARGADDPPLTYQVSPPLVTGDTLNGALARDPGEDYGVYAITQDTLAASSNYVLTYVGANLTIGPVISGSVGVGGATLSYTDGVAKTAVSAPDGSYMLIVSYGWSGSVTPSLSAYTFTPASIAYTSVTSDLTGQNYRAVTQRVLNGGFNTYIGASRIPQYWTATNFGTTSGKDKTIVKEGTASVKIAGTVGKVKTLTQTLALAGAKGDVFNFSFWIRGRTVPLGGICRGQVLFYTGSVLRAIRTIPCGTGTYLFQKKSLTFAAPTSYTKVVIKFTYAKSAGGVWLDAVSLIR